MLSLRKQKRKTPVPGTPARSTRTGRPIMVLLDLLGRRWTLRMIWELRKGPLTFRELQDACDEVSPSVLNQRVKELRESGIVESSADGYLLTRQGLRLQGALNPLLQWSRQWKVPGAEPAPRPAVHRPSSPRPSARSSRRTPAR